MRSSFWLVFLLLLSVGARAAARQDEASLCEQAIAKAEVSGGTPAGMLRAIGQVESGRFDVRNGAMRSWPWTIDAEGSGQFFATKVQAIAAVSALQARGVTSIDVGCMQVNLLQHPDAFKSLEQAFDPLANATYAVRFLNVLHRHFGDWPKVIAAYHSQTPQIGVDYQRRVLVTWQQVVPAAIAPAVVGDGLTHVDSGFVYGAFGSAGRVYGMIMPAPARP